MKITILGDTHFGAGYSFGKIEPLTGHNTRLLDYEKTLANTITYTIDNHIELFVFLGDIFETRNPAPHQMVIFYRQLKRLANAGINVIILMGNHDANINRKITSSLDPLKELRLPNVHIYTGIDTFTFTDSHNEAINVIMIPYRNRQCYGKETNEEALLEMRKELDTAKYKIDQRFPVFSIAHMMFENTLPTDAGEYGLNELTLPFNMLDDMGPILGGHIHKQNILRRDPPIIYSGSMECKDFSEREHKKCFLVYDSAKKGIDAITFMPVETRKFIDFDIDYTSDMPDDPMTAVLERINSENVKEAVVRLHVKVPENKITAIDTAVIRQHFRQLEVSCIADVSVVPVILRQMRNQKINEAPDDTTAFKHYISAQSSVVEGVLEYGLAIMNTENE